MPSLHAPKVRKYIPGFRINLAYTISLDDVDDDYNP